jgi:enamine deaminase RidA (YjgF/YER057c/UK114 family)
MISKYLTFIPELEGSLDEEWLQCLKQIIYEREKGYSLIKLHVFIDSPDFETYIKVSRVIGKNILNAFGKICPVFNITVNPPEKPWKVAAEAYYLEIDTPDILVNINNNVRYIVCSTDSGKEVWGSGLGFALFSSDTKSASEAAFEQMKAILISEGMSFNNIVRQWYFVGKILNEKNALRNWQIFDNVRNKYYRKYHSKAGYPAATGIGMKFGGVTIDFCAVLANEKQSESEPALQLEESFHSTLLVSEEAPVKGEDVIGGGDIEQQTQVAINNIIKIIEQKKIGQNIDNKDIEWGKFILLRVYIKNQSDFSKVKLICLKNFPGIPSIFIESDIYPDNPLVKIEAEFLINI